MKRLSRIQPRREEYLFQILSFKPWWLSLLLFTRLRFILRGREWINEWLERGMNEKTIQVYVITTDFTNVETDHSADCFLRCPFRHKPGDTMMRRLVFFLSERNRKQFTSKMIATCNCQCRGTNGLRCVRPISLCFRKGSDCSQKASVAGCGLVLPFTYLNLRTPHIGFGVGFTQCHRAPPSENLSHT